MTDNIEKMIIREKGSKVKMSKPDRTRMREIKFRVNDEEFLIIRRKMIMARMRNREAFIRKILIEGVIINVDTTPLEEIFYEMHMIGTNINQIAKVANTNRSVNQTELQDLKERVNEIWHILKSFQSELQ